MEIQQVQMIMGIVTSGITIIGLPFLIYTMWIKGQQRDGEKIIDTQKADLLIGSKIDLIVAEIKHLTDSILLIKQNDLHSIVEKQRDQDAQINKLTVAIEKMGTIIEERVPRKTVKEVS